MVKYDNIPQIIYGTAWKKEATTELVIQAVQAGFRGIDTANQPKHYSENQVGKALQELYKQGVSRKDLFLQTKFTPLNGQDHRIPYDPEADLHTQVMESFQSSLKNLGTDYIDSYLLHGPNGHPGLDKSDFETWEAIEEIHESGKAKIIGVSNFNHIQLTTLLEKAKIKPMVVQNRCFARTGWDKLVRDICKQHSVLYEGFSLLTANPFVLEASEVVKMAKELNKTPEQIVFSFSIQIGMFPLTGTTSKKHLTQDLEAINLKLSQEQLNLVEYIYKTLKS